MRTVTAYLGECGHPRLTVEEPCQMCDLLKRCAQYADRIAGQETVIKSLNRVALMDSVAAARRGDGAA